MRSCVAAWCIADLRHSLIWYCLSSARDTTDAIAKAGEIVERLARGSATDLGGPEVPNS